GALPLLRYGCELTVELVELGLEHRLRRKHRLILRDERRRQRAAQRVLDDLRVLRRAQEQPDRWPLVGLANLAVERLEIERQLAHVLGPELADLQLHRHQADEPTVEEEQVDREVLPSHLYGILGADEAEIAPQLGQEPT